MPRYGPSFETADRSHQTPGRPEKRPRLDASPLATSTPAPPIIFKFKRLPDQLKFSHFLAQIAPSSRIDSVTLLRDRSGYLVRAPRTTINQLRRVPTTALADHEFESHVPRERRSAAKPLESHTFVITRVPPTLSDEDLQADLKANYPHISKTMRIVSRTTDKPTTLVRAFVETQQQAESAIQNGVRIGYVLHRCEASTPRPAVQVVQCFKCQKLGHMARECSENDVKCLRCGGNHLVKDCSAPREAVKCTNCQGAHPASYRGCPVFKQATGEKLREIAQAKTTYASKLGSTAQSTLTPLQVVEFVTHFYQEMTKVPVAEATRDKIRRTAIRVARRHFTGPADAAPPAKPTVSKEGPTLSDESSSTPRPVIPIDYDLIRQSAQANQEQLLQMATLHQAQTAAATRLPTFESARSRSRTPRGGRQTAKKS